MLYGMLHLTPIYTRENCRFSCPLQWGLTVFWRKPEPDDGWYQDLATATEPDGIRLLSHRFSEPETSQFAISTQPQVSPLLVVQRVKGRLQHLVGCPIEAAPEEVALGFLNNLAHAHEMKPIYQYGGFVGTVGEYTTKAMGSGTPLHADKLRGGEENG